MKRTLLATLLLVSCDREQTTTHMEEVPPGRPTMEMRSVKPEPPRPMLLSTPRVSISSTGGGIVWKSHIATYAEEILEDIRTLPPSEARDRATAFLIKDLAKTDPERARQMLVEWEDGLIGYWIEAAQGLVRAQAKVDPEAAAAFIERDVPSAARASVWTQFLNEIPPEDRPAFLDRVAPSYGKFKMAANLLYVWVADDPAACATWLDAFTPGLSEDEFQLMRQPNSYPLHPRNDAAPWLAAYRVAESAEARRLLAEGAWSKTSQADRWKLVAELEETLPDLVARERQDRIRDDPALFASRLSAEEAAALSREDSRELIDQWASTNPADAIRWAIKQKRPEAASGLSQLYNQVPAEAITLAHEIPRGPELDQALSSLCSIIAHHGDPDTARSLLPLFSDDAQRMRVLQNLERQSR